MRFELEAAGRHVPDVLGAALDLEDLVAGAAMEVVVVMLAGRLVARRLAGQLDGLERAFLDKPFERAIDGGYP